jgi:hypothetical protein
LFDFRKWLEDGRSTEEKIKKKKVSQMSKSVDQSPKVEGQRKKAEGRKGQEEGKKNTRASLDQVATSAHLVTIIKVACHSKR